MAWVWFSSERDLSEAFHDLLPKRQFVDYYKLIKHPQALNPVQLNVKRKTYTAFADFVKDCAQVCERNFFYLELFSPTRPGPSEISPGRRVD